MKTLNAINFGNEKLDDCGNLLVCKVIVNIFFALANIPTPRFRWLICIPIKEKHIKKRL